MNRYLNKVFQSTLSICLFFLAWPVLAADHMNHGSAHDGMPKSTTKARSTPLPLITIVKPKDGARVAPLIAVEFETTGDLASMTMGSHKNGNHLHFGINDVTLMPAMKDLESLGKNKYRYVFDMPAKPGKHEIKVYWSDGQHKTLEHTVQKISVTVDKSSVGK